MYETVHPNLALELLFERTEVECGKGLLIACYFKSFVKDITIAYGILFNSVVVVVDKEIIT